MKKRTICPSILFGILLVLILTLCFSATAFGASIITGYCGGDSTAEEDAASGCYKNLEWSLDTETGVLNITGTGDMADYSSENPAPWYSHRSNIKTVKIGEFVTTIGTDAFCNCTELKTTYLRGTIEQISGIYVYSGNECLEDSTMYFFITGYCGGDITAENDTYSGCYKNLQWSLDTETGVLNITGRGRMMSFSDESDIPWNGVALNETIKTVNIGDEVTDICDYAFFDCTALTMVNIGDSVTKIGVQAFADCSSLDTVEIPDSVTSIGDYAFCECFSLTTVEMSDSVTSIGEYVFAMCNRLTTVEMSDSVTSIGDFAFISCSALAAIEIPDSVTSLGVFAFSKCTSLNSVKIGHGLTSIGYGVFTECTSLSTLEIPDNVTSIEAAAFYKCTSLTTLTMGVSLIDYAAFGECTALKDVYYHVTKANRGEVSIGEKNECLPDSSTWHTFDSASSGDGTTAENDLASVFSDSTGMIVIGSVILIVAAIVIIVRKKKKSA